MPLGAHMVKSVARGSKRFTANFTFKGSFAGVQTQMQLQRRFGGIALAAHLAIDCATLRLVRLQMPDQSGI